MNRYVQRVERLDDSLRSNLRKVTTIDKETDKIKSELIYIKEDTDITMYDKIEMPSDFEIRNHTKMRRLLGE